jgi:hypothetical protein
MMSLWWLVILVLPKLTMIPNDMRPLNEPPATARVLFPAQIGAKSEHYNDDW